MTPAIRVQIIEDLPIVRQAVERVLEAHPDITVCGSTDNGRDGIASVVRNQPDVVLLDLHLSDMPGLVALERLRNSASHPRVLVYSAAPRTAHALAALQAGACGYISKRCDARDLTNAIVTVHAGGSIVDPSLAAAVLTNRAGGASNEPGDTVLSASETQVLRLLSDGATDRDIAASTYVSVRTVQNQLARLRRRTGTARRADLTRWALENDWL